MPFKRDCRWDAKKLLADNQEFNVRRILTVEPDAVLYETKDGHARTAWLRTNQHTGEVMVRIVDGFPAWPETG